MAAEEDNFDIDIYGDGGEEYQDEGQDRSEIKVDDPIDPIIQAAENIPQTMETSAPETSNGQDPPPQDMAPEKPHLESNDVAQKITSTDDAMQDSIHLPKQAPQTQGLKRKDGTDNRLVDPGATNALFVSELHWWITDDDIRGWANQSECEDELEEITFSEHKVNGKSKGQAYVLFKSPQAATAAKHKIESFGEGQQYTKRYTVSYTNPFTNPFRTLPKDGPMRNSNGPSNRSQTNSQGGMGAYNPQQPNYNMNNNTGGYRGGRGAYNNNSNNRGGSTNNMAGYNRGGYQPSMPNFSGASMGGFPNPPMGAMPNYSGFQNRGGMMGGMRGGGMGMRGGRGGMNTAGGMMGMPMGGMGMGAMGSMGAMAMGMPHMGGGMGMQGMQGSHNSPSIPTVTPATHSLYPGYTSQHSQGSTYSSTPHESAAAVPVAPYSWPQGGTNAPPSYLHQSTASFPSTQPRASFPTSTYTASSTQLPANSPSSIQPTASFPSSSMYQTTFLDTSAPLISNQGNTIPTSSDTSSHPGSGGFQGAAAHYNPAFFPQSGGGDAGWNPHGAKRTRQE